MDWFVLVLLSVLLSTEGNGSRSGRVWGGGVSALARGEALYTAVPSFSGLRR